MRLDNGAINCAGQGHNEATVGLDRCQVVCITLCQKGLSPGLFGAARLPRAGTVAATIRSSTEPLPKYGVSAGTCRGPFHTARARDARTPRLSQPPRPARRGNYYAA
jgi:hypothetical protein